MPERLFVAQHVAWPTVPFRTREGLSSAAVLAWDAVTSLAQSKENGPTPARVVAAGRGILERFLLKVLKPLVSARILASIKGPNGGYKLTRTPQSLSLLEIIEAVDGPIRGLVPRLDHNSNSRLDKNLEQVCTDAAEVVRTRLGRVKLSALMGK